MRYKVCDRCKKPYDDSNLKDINLYDNWWRFELRKDCHPYGEIDLHLCPDCKKSLYNWFNNK